MNNDARADEIIIAASTYLQTLWWVLNTMEDSSLSYEEVYDTVYGRIKNMNLVANYEIDQYIRSRAPPPDRICAGQDCGWTGYEEDCVTFKHGGPPLCPICNEITEGINLEPGRAADV